MLKDLKRKGVVSSRGPNILIFWTGGNENRGSDIFATGQNTHMG